MNHKHVKGSVPRRYEYPTEIVVDGEGSLKDVKQAMLPILQRRDVPLLSSYGNPYLCTIENITISKLGKTKYVVTAQGYCVRTFRTNQSEFLKEEEKLEQLALQVYDVFFKEGNVIKFGDATYSVHTTSRTGVKYVEIDGYSFIEQNPEKASRWGEKAREGHNILWITLGRRYVAQVIDRKYVVLSRKK